MGFDLAVLTSTPDIRNIAPVHARIVCALRYTHVTRRCGTYCARELARQLGSRCAVHSFHVFLDEVGCAWPDPVALNPPCQFRLSYDEMLLIDLSTAAAQNDRPTFDTLVEDMLGESSRRAIWFAGRRLMKYLVTIVH